MTTVAQFWQSYSDWILVCLAGIAVSFVSSLAALRLAQRSGMIVQPGARQSHVFATPTGGGLGLIFGLLVASLFISSMLPLPSFWWQRMLPATILLSLIGWVDDRRQVATLLRLLVQFTVSLWLVESICFWDSMSDIGLCVGIIFAIVWLMNLYNFMDGSNGMAGFEGVFVALVMAFFLNHVGEHAMALLAGAVAAVCAGFLPLNFPRARVFMGDVASVPLGFVFAALAVYGIKSGAMGLAILILAMSVFVVDATLTLVARVLCGERWYTAHNQHLYQRLIVQGWSHSRVLMAYQAVNVGLVLPAIVLVAAYPQYAAGAAGLVLILLSTCWYLINRRLGMRASAQLK